MEVIHPRCAGLDVHKETVVACVRLAVGDTVNREVKTFETTTSGLLRLLASLSEQGCTHVAMEATGVYWKPVWNILSDGAFELVSRVQPFLPRAAISRAECHSSNECWRLAVRRVPQRSDYHCRRH